MVQAVSKLTRSAPCPTQLTCDIIWVADGRAGVGVVLGTSGSAATLSALLLVLPLLATCSYTYNASVWVRTSFSVKDRSIRAKTHETSLNI